MSDRQFDMFRQKLSSRMIVEASAGTGKTYNIVGLFIRLLIQKELNVNEILVVTFTRMATRELKERLLIRLRESLQVATGEEYDGPDPFLKELASFCRDYENSKDTLKEALRNFDEAQVHTIHGFCQKVLMEEALVSGMPFDFDVLQTDTFLVEATEDFWRSFIARYSETEAGRYYINKVRDFGSTPEELLETLMPLFAKQYADPEPGDVKIDVSSLLESIIEERKKITKVWQKEREDVLEELVRSDISGLGEKRVKQLGVQFDQFINDRSYMLDQPKNLEKFTSSYLNDERNLNKNGSIQPSHRLFEYCEDYSVLVDQLPDLKTSFLLYAFHQIRSLREQKSREASQLSYNDLLFLLDQALSAPETGAKLASTIRTKYPVALVDEFQDTDPVQYRIFDKIYEQTDDSNSSMLMLIGDPKQAIYGFRGADVYAYLRAKERVSSNYRYTLRNNYRSSKGLIAGVNALFSSSTVPFIEDKISFSKAEKGELPTENVLNYRQESHAPLQVYYHDGIRSGEKATRHLFQLVTEQIDELIRKGEHGEVSIGENRLMAGDIAVLVSSNREAAILKDYLKNHGVDSVTYSREQVFETVEANRILRFMSAVLNPSDRRSVQTALSTGFFGSDVGDIYEYQQDEEAWEVLIEQMRDLNETWNDAGFYPMFRKFLFEKNALVHLAKIYNSERVITNIQQLAEISSYAEQENGFDPSGLYYWFRKQIEEPGDNEEQTLRLESDRHLVKISTIHNSKGLEFPVVFLPVLWKAKKLTRNKHVNEYHDPEDGYRAVLNVDQKENNSRKKAEFRGNLESVAENVRKAYVALTRAKYECRIFWSATRNSHFSGLGAGLLGRDRVIPSVEKKETLQKSETVSDQDFRQKFEDLSRTLPGIVSFHEISQAEEWTGERKYDPKTEIKQDSLSWNPARLPNRLFSRKQLFSFSSLLHNDSNTVAEPDYDQWLERYIERTNEYTNQQQEEATIFSFPRGAMAGTLIHKLFEHPDFDFRRPGGKGGFIRDILLEFGFDERWLPPLKMMMTDVVRADYQSLNLDKVSPDSLLKEMEFNFPVTSPAVEDVIRLIRPDEGLGQNSASAHLVRSDIKGFMTGFIDLIVRYRGVYYILDYKSNYLGDTLKDYQNEYLISEIYSAGYDVQYHLYTLALKKFLERRDPDFDYEKNFGGVFYLFIRGIRARSSNGIYYDKPDLQTLQLLDQLLKRGGRTNDD